MQELLNIEQFCPRNLTQKKKFKFGQALSWYYWKAHN
jgi:hypothetical protein